MSTLLVLLALSGSAQTASDPWQPGTPAAAAPAPAAPPPQVVRVEVEAVPTKQPPTPAPPPAPEPQDIRVEPYYFLPHALTTTRRWLLIGVAVLVAYAAPSVFFRPLLKNNSHPSATAAILILIGGLIGWFAITPLLLPAVYLDHLPLPWWSGLRYSASFLLWTLPWVLLFFAFFLAGRASRA